MISKKVDATVWHPLFLTNILIKRTYAELYYIAYAPPSPPVVAESFEWAPKGVESKW